MINSTNNKGFTLIELLVVIAIIGLLAALIIVALTRVRLDAFNVRIQSDVRQMRALAESAYDSSGASYLNWSQSPTVTASVTELLNDIDEAHGDALGAPYQAALRESQPKEFCVSAPLHASTGGHACVDATGILKITAQPCQDAPDPLVCP